MKVYRNYILHMTVLSFKSFQWKEWKLNDMSLLYVSFFPFFSPWFFSATLLILKCTGTGLPSHTVCHYPSGITRYVKWPSCAKSIFSQNYQYTGKCYIGLWWWLPLIIKCLELKYVSVDLIVKLTIYCPKDLFGKPTCIVHPSILLGISFEACLKNKPEAYVAIKN